MTLRDALRRSRLGPLVRRRGPGGQPPAPFVVGVARSGTTLLRMMLDAHPALAIPAETHFVPPLIQSCTEGRLEREEVVGLLVGDRRWPEFGLEPDAIRARLPATGAVDAATAVRSFYLAYAERSGKPRWGDKTPGYLLAMGLIERTLPEARFVHVIRDARDVALSMTQAELTMPDSVAQAAQRWTKQLRKGMREAEGVRHYIDLRYEDLVLDTEPTLRRVCGFLELEWDPAVLDYHLRAAARLQEAAAHDRPRPGKPPIPAWYPQQIHARTGQPPMAERVGRWRREMNDEDTATCERIAGELLAELGYELTAPRQGIGQRA